MTEPGEWFLAPRLWADMDAWHAAVASIRASTPVLHVDRPGYTPFWVLTRHADVFAVSRDNDLWHNTTRSVLGLDADQQRLVDSGLPEPKTLVHIDGDDHRMHRAVTNDWFKPAAVGRRQPRIEEIADEFIAPMRSFGGACDFARDIAQPYTLRVIMDIYGVPSSDEPLMLSLTQGLFGAADPEFMGDAASSQDKVMESVFRFINYFNVLTQDRRGCPTEDLASVIANAEMDDEHRLWYFMIVATAGHDTTSFALSGGMEQLVRTGQWSAVAADPSLVVGAADEMIRWTSPVRHFLRYAQSATSVGDVAIPEGGRVLLSYPSANRDEDVFERASSFDVTRPDSDKLLSFGLGAHFCLGAQFARRELRTMIGRLLPQLSSVSLAGEPQWSESHFVSGVKHLPLEYSFA